MGLCLNKPSTERTLTKELRHDKEIDNLKKKLLILGPMKSGKSTIFNQLKYIHGNGFNHTERMNAKQSIFLYIIESMQNIIECVQEYEKFKQYPLTPFSLNNEAKISAQFIKSLSLKQNMENNMNEIISSHIKTLCKQSAIKKIITNPSKYYIDDIGYFLENISRISKSEYIPTDQDIIQLRIKCDGFNEAHIEMGRDHFIVYDLNYKPDICNINKLMHCFENITAIIFVVSLCCFDEAIFEDEKSYRQKLEWKQSLCSMQAIVGDDILSVVLLFVGYPKNAMHDALDVFDELCNNEWFRSIPVLLFLSKSDLFESKMKVNDDDMNGFNICFPHFKGKCNYKACWKYIVEQFEERNRINGDRNNRTIYKHLVNGRDTNIMRKIFEDVQNIIISYSLHHAGLL